MTVTRLPGEDQRLQEQILESLEDQPGKTSAELAHHLLLPHELVQWQVVCLFHRRRLTADRSKPPRYHVAGAAGEEKTA